MKNNKAHQHDTYVEGCFRCELSRDETARATIARIEALIDAGYPYISRATLRAVLDSDK